jgi:hypothetical protein
MHKKVLYLTCIGLFLLVIGFLLVNLSGGGAVAGKAYEVGTTVALPGLAAKGAGLDPQSGTVRVGQQFRVTVKAHPEGDGAPKNIQKFTNYHIRVTYDEDRVTYVSSRQLVGGAGWSGSCSANGGQVSCDYETANPDSNFVSAQLSLVELTFSANAIDAGQDSMPGDLGLASISIVAPVENIFNGPFGGTDVTIPCVQLTYYLDSDDDGSGDRDMPGQFCLHNAEVTSGNYVDNNNDCDDDDAPNCIADCVTQVYRDADGDGAGSKLGGADQHRQCDAPAGFVALSNDCDDSDDTEKDSVTWFKDHDGDGYDDGTNVCERGPGDAADWKSDEAPDNFATNGPDCDDNDIDTFNSVQMFSDSDGDGFHGTAEQVCRGAGIPVGYSEQNTDCVDDNDQINPGVDEVCDAVDNNCDGAVDETEDALCRDDVNGNADDTDVCGTCNPVVGEICHYQAPQTKGCYTTCDDTCDSLGYICGFHYICNQLVDCNPDDGAGGHVSLDEACPIDGEICLDGQCQVAGQCGGNDNLCELHLQTTNPDCGNEVKDPWENCRTCPEDWDGECPAGDDTDGDGIPDEEEICYDDAGNILAKEDCDQDGDGIPDFEEADADGDEIEDFLDQCPGTDTQNGFYTFSEGYINYDGCHVGDFAYLDGFTRRGPDGCVDGTDYSLLAFTYKFWDGVGLPECPSKFR